MTIGAISLFSYTPLGGSLPGAGSRASTRNADTADNIDSLLGALGAGLRTLDARDDAIARITTQLTALRDALKASGSQGTSGSARSDLRALFAEFEQTVEKVTAATQDVYETQPVYEQQDILDTTVTGTQTLTGYSNIYSAGIIDGNDFSVQVGSGSAATIEFKSATKVRITIDGNLTDFNFTFGTGGWRTALVDALNTVANLSASITAGGKLQMQTANAESLTIADVAGGGSPLAELGLSAGTTNASVVGTQQVQVGTEDVLVGTEQVEGGTIQISQGTQSIVVGYDKISTSAPDPTSTATVRDSLKGLISAVGALMAATGGAAASSAPGLSGDARAFAASLSELLQSPDFNALGNITQADAFDRVIGKLDDALGQAKAISARVANSPDRVGAALQLQASLNAALLSSTQTFATDSAGLARRSTQAFRSSPAGHPSGHTMSIWS